jgi:TonB family protein
MAQKQDDTSSPSSALKESEPALQDLFMNIAAARRSPSEESNRAVQNVVARLNSLIEVMSQQLAARQDSAKASLLRERIGALREYLKMVKPANERDLFVYDEVDKPARLTYKPEPGFTDKARGARISGRVRVRAVLSADGTVKHIVPTESLGYGLTERSVEATRQVRFEPATKGGRAVSTIAIFEYTFNQ